jgi:hypothetical protein
MPFTMKQLIECFLGLKKQISEKANKFYIETKYYRYKFSVRIVVVVLVRRKANRYPFIFLILIHVCMFMYTLYKCKDRKRIVTLLLSNMGMAYLFEYVAFNILQSYTYKPNFLKIKALDNTIGALLSQAIFVPITALFITTFKLGWKAKLFFSLYFFVIEKVFIFLGIFTTNWWRTVYTATLIPGYFYLSDFWDKHLQKGTPIVLFLSLFNSLVVINSTILYSLAIFRKIRFGVGVNHSWREHFIIAPLYTIALASITTWAMQSNNMATLLNLSFRLSLDQILKKQQILRSNLKFRFEILFHFFMIFVAKVLKIMIYSEQKNK